MRTRTRTRTRRNPALTKSQFRTGILNLFQQFGRDLEAEMAAKGAQVNAVLGMTYDSLSDRVRAKMYAKLVEKGALPAPVSAPPTQRGLTDKEGWAMLAELASKPGVLTGISDTVRANIVAQFESRALAA